MRRPSSPRDKSVNRVLIDQGRALFQRVFQGDVLVAFDKAYRRARRRRGTWFRLQFSFDGAPEAVNLPWEALVGPEGNALALLSRISIERRLIKAPAIEKPRLSTPGKIRVLLVGASPAEMPKLDLAAEMEWIETALRKVCDIRLLEHATESSLAKALAEEPGFDVVHFLGHGDFEGEEGGLWLENESGGGERLTSSELLSTLRNPVSFVFLNVCHGGRGSAHPFAGLAEALLRSGVRAVVAMRREISDPGAVSLAQHFYDHVRNRDPLTRAMAKARRAVDPRLGDWSVPLLFLAEEDFALLPASKKIWIGLATLAAGIALCFWLWSLPKLPVVPKDPRCPAPAGLDLPFVFIPRGTFDQGSATGEKDERPVHSVTLTRDFCIGAFEVTQGLYAKVLRQGPVPPPRTFFPVESATWQNAKQFAAKLEERIPGAGFRLPTSAEWEYAARAGLVGDEAPESSLAANCSGSASEAEARAMPVGSFPQNAWGLYDMKGNVWEWVEDWEEAYPSGSVLDPQGPAAGEDKVRRGGGYASSLKNCRVSTLQGVKPDRKQEAAGFRVVRDPVVLPVGMR